MDKSRNGESKQKPDDSKTHSHKGKVATLKDKYDKMNTKPNIPPKTFKLVDGRAVLMTYVNNDNSSIDSDCSRGNTSNAEEMDCEVETPTQPKATLITNEWLKYVNLVIKSLKYVIAFRKELNVTFKSQEEQLRRAFKEIDTLNMLYKLIIDTHEKLVSNPEMPFRMPDIFLEPGVAAFLRMYKPFLMGYADNAKMLGDLDRNQNAAFTEACRRAKESITDADPLVTLDSCLYTVFNSLFSYELIFGRYMNCFESTDEEYRKAEEVKKILSTLLGEINTSQNKENFINTQKELSLLSGRNRDSKINSKFIYKGDVKKCSRRDGHMIQRQLVLFSDCLYVTLVPSSLTGQASVRQEMSLDGMVVSDCSERVTATDSTLEEPDQSSLGTDELTTGSLPSAEMLGSVFTINIRTREADQDFIFDDLDSLNTWKTNLRFALDSKVANSDSAVSSGGSVSLNGTGAGSSCSNPSLYSLRKNSVLYDTNDVHNWLGQRAPRWQKDKMSRFCNGISCTREFSNTVRRHHCRADGLLYCESCCNYRIKLTFERYAESRVCGLCYRILFQDMHKPENLEQAKSQLSSIFAKKLRLGRRMCGWLEVRFTARETGRLNNNGQRFYCVMEMDPFMSLYECMEDKTKKHGIMLVGMRLCDSALTNVPCKKHGPLKDTQIALEHEDKAEMFMLKTMDRSNCQLWKSAIQENLTQYYSESNQGS